MTLCSFYFFVSDMCNHYAVLWPRRASIVPCSVRSAAPRSDEVTARPYFIQCALQIKTDSTFLYWLLRTACTWLLLTMRLKILLSLNFFIPRVSSNISPKRRKTRDKPYTKLSSQRGVNRPKWPQSTNYAMDWERPMTISGLSQADEWIRLWLIVLLTTCKYIYSYTTTSVA